MDGGLVKLSEAVRALAEAKSFDEVLLIRDKAVAAQAWIKAARMGIELQNDATEIKLRAERKAGEWLASTPMHNGDPRLQDATRLEDVGVDKHQSHRWQKIASVPEEDFNEHIQLTKDAEKELTTASVLRLASGEPEIEKWSIGDAIRAMSKSAKKIADRCPTKDRETLGHKLISLGREILECGELR